MPFPVIPDDELDRLYGLPLEEFTRARDDFARELRKAGEPEMAAEVKALAKPSLSTWTVNQLARREPMQVRALMTPVSGSARLNQQSRRRRSCRSSRLRFGGNAT